VSIIVFVFMDAKPEVQRPDGSSISVTPYIKRVTQRIKREV
jgi:hypothetical protein